MQHSVERILTSHVGSLIRPQQSRIFCAPSRRAKPWTRGPGTSASPHQSRRWFASRPRPVSTWSVMASSARRSAGPNTRSSACPVSSAVRFEPGGKNPFARGADRAKFAEFYAELDARETPATISESVCAGPITYTGQQQLKRDIDNFKAALAKSKVTEGFLPVAAPSSVIPDRKNEYYPSDEACQRAIAEAMRTEYRMIVDAGLLVQLDDARAAVTYDRMVPPASFAEYLKWLEMQVDLINHALEGIPEEKVRYHVCWGSWPGPHTSDVALKDIAHLVLQVKAGAYVIEGANPRHEHEWRVWKDVKLPAGKMLMPGVISHATNVVEHPELVCERIVSYAAAGRPRERHRRNRLRLCSRPVLPPRASQHHVGQA